MKINKGETIDRFFVRLREENIYEVPEKLQGISTNNIMLILKKIDRLNIDQVHVIFALLDNALSSVFSKGKDQYKFSDGASVAHIACYVGILMRGKTKLDREGRDYWLKPMTDIGAIEKITFTSEGTFVPGHIKAKSPNSAYRLNDEFVELLQSVGNEKWEEKLAEWISSSKERVQLRITVEAAELAKQETSGHKQLINDSIELYAKHFLPKYTALFKDDSDGDRISKEEELTLKKHNIKLELEDVWPDAILINEDENKLWFIEAVTSDGEVDNQKLKGFYHICKKSGKDFGGATTTYNDWSRFASRQQKNKNLAGYSYVWILEDPEKHFFIRKPE